tara:strand:- start:96 stop:464 length:369 start_codon:yes stop_codon:yes gene_type:complete
MRMDLKFITILIMSCFYMNVGVKHFIEPEWFLQIMPPNFPHHYQAVYWSGFFELLFGFLLINPKTRFIAGWGIIFVMITVFPANLYLAVNDGAVMGISKELAWGRLPFQYVFIGLAYWHAQG